MLDLLDFDAGLLVVRLLRERAVELVDGKVHERFLSEERGEGHAGGRLCSSGNGRLDFEASVA